MAPAVRTRSLLARAGTFALTSLTCCSLVIGDLPDPLDVSGGAGGRPSAGRSSVSATSAGRGSGAAGGASAARGGGAGTQTLGSSGGVGTGGSADDSRAGSQAAPDSGGSEDAGDTSSEAGHESATSGGGGDARGGSAGGGKGGGRAGTGGSPAGGAGGRGGSSPAGGHAGGGSAGMPSQGGMPAVGGGGDSGRGGMAPDCDADHDGHASLSTPGCNGDDCDDADSNTYPGQTAFFTVERASGGFDYDCDGVEARAWSEGLDCSLLGGSVLNGCEGQGFSGSAPACGESAAWIECAPSLPPLSVCQAADAGSKVQACR